MGWNTADGHFLTEVALFPQLFTPLPHDKHRKMAWVGILLVVLVKEAIGRLDFLHGRPTGGFVLKPPNVEELDRIALQTDAKIEWFTQFLDHFNPLETRTFQQVS